MNNKKWAIVATNKDTNAKTWLLNINFNCRMNVEGNFDWYTTDDYLEGSTLTFRLQDNAQQMVNILNNSELNYKFEIRVITYETL